MNTTITRIFVALGLLGLGLVLASCDRSEQPRPRTAEEVEQSENVIEGLRPQLAALAKGVLNLSFPDVQSRSIFEPEVSVTDLAASPPTAWTPVLDLGARRASWPATPRASSASRDDLALWEEYLETVDFFHHFGFHNIRGGFTDDSGDRYRTVTTFDGLAQLSSGEIESVTWTVEMQVRALQMGLRIEQVPVPYRRRLGVSKISGTVRGVVLAGYYILTTIARLYFGRRV